MAMDLLQYRDKLNVLAEGLNAVTERVYVENSIELLAAIKNRIANEGKNSAGSLIGSYSTKPMYATVDQFAVPSAFKARGIRESVSYGLYNVKTKRTRVPKRQTFVVGGKRTAVVTGVKGYALGMRERTAMYLPGGYKELRNIQGRRVDIVNLTYRGDLLNNGYQMQAVENAILLGFISERFKLIRQGLEKRFGGSEIFHATAEEMEQFNTRVMQQLDTYNREVFAS